MTRRELSWTSNGRADYVYWQSTDRTILKRINVLLDDCVRGNDSDGIGKPERLRHDLSGYWSRRINHEHRLVYGITDTSIIVVSARQHY